MTSHLHDSYLCASDQKWFRNATQLLLAFVFSVHLSGQSPALADSKTDIAGVIAPSAEDADWAMSRAVRYLSAEQSRRGGWADGDIPDPDGVTALATYALFHSRIGTPELNRAMGGLLRDEDERTILAHLFTLNLLSAAGNKKTRLQTEKIIRFLELQQLPCGGWPLQTGDANPHGPMTFLVLQSLDDAVASGFRVSKNLWQQAERFWLESQHADGGWSILPLVTIDMTAPHEKSNISGTATGLAALHVIYERMYLNAELAFTGRFKAKCGTSVPQTKAIKNATAEAIAWLDERYATGHGLVPSNRLPKDGSLFTSGAYQFFAMTRAAIPTGRMHFGGVDWYRSAVAALINTQQKDGSWTGVARTSLVLAGMNRAHAPILFQKLQFSSDETWNLDPLDIDHLTRSCQKRFEQVLSWRTITLDANQANLNDAPILYFNGHEVPDISESQRRKLRTYVDGGGTLLAVACCTRKEFVSGVTEMISSMLPRLQMAPLHPDHPVWDWGQDVPHKEDCIGFGDGCRTSVFVLTSGACCAWHQNRTKDYQRLFSLAENIALYATFDRPLQSRLALRAETDLPRTPPAVRVATLRHGGDWWSEPGALVRLSHMLAARHGLELQVDDPIEAAAAMESATNVLWITGHDFALTDDADPIALRNFVNGGGTIVASACCGRDPFDRAFRRVAQESFGEAKWEHVPADDPLLTGGFAPHMAATLKSMGLRKRLNGNIPPRLDWPILFGVRDGDRWAVLYSPIDLACGIVGHACTDCVGLEPRDARAMAANLMLYAALQSLASSAR